LTFTFPLRPLPIILFILIQFRFFYFYSYDFEFDAFFLATLFLFDFFVCASIEGKSTHEKKRKLKWNRMVPFCLIPSGLCYFFPLRNLKINPIKLNLLFFIFLKLLGITSQPIKFALIQVWLKFNLLRF